jgi:hypothetical protein
MILGHVLQKLGPGLQRPEGSLQFFDGYVKSRRQKYFPASPFGRPDGKRKAMKWRMVLGTFIRGYSWCDEEISPIQF